MRIPTILRGLNGLGDCDPTTDPNCTASVAAISGSVYGVDSAGNTIVNPGTPGAVINTTIGTGAGLPQPTSTSTFAQTFYAQTGIQFQSAALFIAGIVLVMSLGGSGKRR